MTDAPTSAPHLGDAFGINTYAYTQAMTAADCIGHLADTGVRAFELMFFPGHLWVDDDEATLQSLRRSIADGDHDLMSVNGPNIDLNIAAAVEAMRRHSIDLNSAYLRIAGALGARGLILGPGKANPLFPLPRATLEGHFFRALDTLLPLAESCGVRLWVENMPFAFLPDANGLMDALARYGADEIGICYDVANAHFIGEDPVAGLKRVAPRLALVHISDTTRAVYRHDAVGKGDIDFTALPAALGGVGYGDRPMLEIISEAPDGDLDLSVRALRNAGFTS